ALQTKAAPQSPVRIVYSRDSASPAQTTAPGIGGRLRNLWRKVVGTGHRSELVEHQEEINRLREQLASATAQRAEVQRRVEELLAAHEQEATEIDDALESERARLRDEFETLTQAERSRHAEELAEVQARAAQNAQLAEQLRAEILRLGASQPTREAELETARREIAELRRRLNERETNQQSMSSLLEGMGIRIH
ncbi:MAG: hypothetical protein ACP5XB_04510, partial [Isosphaeraceae bacterium]